VSKRNSAQLQWRASSILWTLDATLSGQLAKPSHLPVANRSSSPLNRLRHREGFVGDHRLQSCVSALLRRGNLWRLVRRAQLRLRLRAFLCAGGVRPLTTTPRLYLRCRQSGCLSHRPLAHNHHLLNRQTRTPLRRATHTERSQTPIRAARRTSLRYPQCRGPHTSFIPGLAASESDR
jgi:hypothetical protein